MHASWWNPRQAAHNIWRLKFNALPLALLVTWHVQGEGRAKVQVSIQSVHRPELHTVEAAVHLADEHVQINDVTIGAAHTKGAIGDVRWDLRMTPLASPIRMGDDEGPARFLPLTTRLISLPAVRFEGELVYRGERWQGTALGAAHHAWGHSLPRHWLWVHGSGCGDKRAGVEAVRVQQRLAGLPWPAWTMGYMWLRTGDQERLLMSPRHGHMSINGLPDQFVLRVTPWHGTGYALYGRSHTRMWQKLGRGIINTLGGHVRIPGVLDCSNVATIEWRNPPVS